VQEYKQARRLIMESIERAQTDGLTPSSPLNIAAHDAALIRNQSERCSPAQATLESRFAQSPVRVGVRVVALEVERRVTARAGDASRLRLDQTRRGEVRISG